MKNVHVRFEKRQDYDYDYDFHSRGHIFGERCTVSFYKLQNLIIHLIRMSTLTLINITTYTTNSS